MATPRMIEEYVPLYFYSTGIALYICIQAIGGSLSLFAAALLPPADDPVALKNSQVYLFILAFPIPLYIIMVILLFTVLPYDSPKFYIVQDQKQ